MKLTEPAPYFNRKATRLHIYLWKWRKCRFIRLPSGAGLYQFVPTEQPLALQLPTGERFRLTLPPTRAALPYFAAWRDFIPVGYGDLLTALRAVEWRTDAIKALSVPELRRRFGAVPVAPEDAYSSGQCWFGSKAWAEVWLGSPAPPVSLQLSRLDKLPPVEVSAFIHAAAFAAAYVVGDRSPLLEGVTEADIDSAIREDRKADGSGRFRLPRLNANIHQKRRDGQVITASSVPPCPRSL